MQKSVDMKNQPSIKDVKLIVSDMDGTLLNEEKQLPNGFFEMLDQLWQRGIRFAIASGRSYPTLYEQFKEVADRMTFIAENGSCIVDRGELLSACYLKPEEAKRLYDIIRMVPGIYPLMSCLKHVYVPGYASEEAKRIVRAYYANDSIACFDEMEDIEEPVIKITICCPDGAGETGMPYLTEIRSPYQVIWSGYYWIDCFAECASKGEGIGVIQKRLGITKEESMLFGDYLNDLSMVPFCYFSYAMANSHPDFLTACRFRTASNTEDGVMEVLRKIV